MANTNETVADIIAEMLGARTEFPFVYLIGEPDTPEVIDFSTKAIIAPRKINIRRVTVNELADRLKAALKREKAAIEADALAVGGIVEAAHRRESGDCAKLRDALRLCMDEMCNCCRDLAAARGNPLPCLRGCEPVRKAKAALDVPDIGTNDGYDEGGEGGNDAD